MKKLFLILILALGWLVSNGQTGPVFQYTHPAKQVLQGLAKEETTKGYAYRTYLVESINLGLIDTTLKVSAAYLDFIFNHLFLEEVYLTEGSYMNSGYDPSTGKMDPSVGHKWTGFAWVFRVGTYSIILIKEDCGNILRGLFARKLLPITQKSEPIVTLSTFKQEDWSFTSPRKMYEEKITAPIFLGSEKTKTKTWFGRKWPWFAGAIVASGVTSYLLLQKKGGSLLIIEPRTMPPGIPAVPATPTPGLPSDPRTMPGGIGLNFSFSF